MDEDLFGWFNYWVWLSHLQGPGVILHSYLCKLQNSVKKVFLEETSGKQLDQIIAHVKEQQTSVITLTLGKLCNRKNSRER